MLVMMLERSSESEKLQKKIYCGYTEMASPNATKYFLANTSVQIMRCLDLIAGILEEEY